MTQSITYSELYLKSLRTLDGKSFTWTRNGSHYVSKISGIEDVMVDEYQLYLNGEKYGVIYMCPYGRSASYTPRGLTLSKEQTRGHTGDGFVCQSIKIKKHLILFYFVLY